jgi:EAL domain-containing protein (putative c-di-GMP-specific phosphodiesterase class I)
MHRFSLHADLMRALDDDELVTYYQPIVALGSGELLGAEALVRWRHPELGLLTPDGFLRVAELSGLIDRIDRIVMDHACAWLAEIDTSEPGLVPWVNVNVSPDSFRSPDLVDRITETLDRHGLDAGRLGIEITEDLLIDHDSPMQEVLQQLRDLGVRLALDDFGTGYSSLSYLRDLPVDMIKIAKPFIDDIDRFDSSRSAHAFTSAIVALVTTLDRFIVAEGIERPEQAHVLRDLGCQAGQGYHYRRPMTADAFVDWARTRRDTSSLATRPDDSPASSGTVVELDPRPSPVG